MPEHTTAVYFLSVIGSEQLKNPEQFWGHQSRSLQCALKFDSLKQLRAHLDPSNKSIDPIPSNAVSVGAFCVPMTADELDLIARAGQPPILNIPGSRIQSYCILQRRQEIHQKLFRPCDRLDEIYNNPTYDNCALDRIEHQQPASVRP